MKKLLAALLAVCCLLLSGCSLFFPGLEESSSSAPAEDPARYASEYSGGWNYQRLDDRLQTGYAEVYTALRDRFGTDEQVTISDSAQGTSQEYLGLRVELSEPLHTREEAEQLYTTVTGDNPQFFYIGNTYSYEGYRKGGVDYYDVFCLVFTMDAQERGQAAVQLEEAVASLMEGVPAGDPQQEFQAELLLYDRLAERCTYETRAAGEADPAASYPAAFTAYGALVEGRAVCEGYARAMQLLLHRAGIACTLVTGTDEEQVSHMWNLVTVEGKNYHLDPTWGDSGDRLSHAYFNLTTEEILRTHTIDAGNLGVDTCTAVDANYYVRLGLDLDTARRDEIAAVIAREIEKGSTAIDLRFSFSTFASARLFVNNHDLLTQKVNEQLAGTGLSMWDYKDYWVNESYGTIAIYQ
ncbi:MAG TPA: hypothetical protein H9674_03955 [Firmicutes bacterium]|nr:hypothetical protein [Bacillota bacterium]